jgi:hypothetical protein
MLLYSGAQQDNPHEKSAAPAATQTEPCTVL